MYMLKQFLKTIGTKHRAKKTIEGLEYMLTHAQEFFKKPLEKADWNNLMDYIIHLRDTEGLSDSTIALHQTKLRQFYSFCFDETDDPRYLKISKKLKTSIPTTKFNPHDILLPEDVKKLINVATLERDRCIVATLFESGMRLGELLSLTREMVEMKEVHETDDKGNETDRIKSYEVIFHIPDVEGNKTGARTVVCVEIYNYVQDWYKCNPSKQFMPVGRRTVAEILVRLFEKANIKKPANPHALRHAAITHCVNIGMQQNAIGERFWGNVSTNMLKTYISLSIQMQASAYKNAKGMGNGNGNMIINPLASRCVNCGKLIQSGSLCKLCEDSKKLLEENENLNSIVKKLLVANQDAATRMNRLEEKHQSYENLVNKIIEYPHAIPMIIGELKKYEESEQRYKSEYNALIQKKP